MTSGFYSSTPSSLQLPLTLPPFCLMLSRRAAVNAPSLASAPNPWQSSATASTTRKRRGSAARTTRWRDLVLLADLDPRDRHCSSRGRSSARIRADRHVKHSRTHTHAHTRAHLDPADCRDWSPRAATAERVRKEHAASVISPAWLR